MPRRRIVAALLFTAAGITPLAALGVAWGEQQGWTSESTVTVSGRVAKTFPAPAKPSTPPPAPVTAPATATQAAPVPPAVEPTATRTEATKAPTGTARPGPKPTGKPSQTMPADPDPTGTTTSPVPPAVPDPPAESGN